MLKYQVLCIVAAFLAIAGCAPARTAAPADATLAAVPRVDAKGVSDKPAPPEMAELALRIAAKHLSVPSSELEIVQIEPVEWRDSSLGCPEPGMEYLHVITPGYHAVVRHRNGATHRVHMSASGGFVCEARPEKAATGPSPLPTFSQSQLASLARADLAHRLGVPAEQVSIVRTRPVEWPDATLGGCANADMAPGTGRSKGFVIALAHRSREYTYHADLRQAVPCPPIERQ